MLTSAAIIAGMCVGSICLASLAAKAADRGHEQHIEIMSYQLGNTANPPTGPSGKAQQGNPTTAGAGTSEGGGGAAKKRRVDLSTIPITKKYDQASPMLEGTPPAPPPPPPAPPPARQADGAATTGSGFLDPHGPRFLGGVTVAAGDINGPAPKGPTSLTGLGSLQSVGTVGTLFLNSRGGDQAPVPGADARLRLGTGAMAAGAGGSPGCTVACSNNLNTGNPPTTGAAPMEQFSMNYAKVQPNAMPAPGVAPQPAAPVLLANPTVGAGPGAGPHVKVFDGRIDSKPTVVPKTQTLVRTR
jgi:hypothetical protein